jgi:hypothetical protein
MMVDTSLAKVLLQRVLKTMQEFYCSYLLGVSARFFFFFFFFTSLAQAMG